MANREFRLDADITAETVTVDLIPPFFDMPRSLQELELFRGDAATINFVVTQNGQAFNLTDYTVKYQAKRAIGDTSFVFDKTASHTDASGGKTRVVLSGSDLSVAQSLQTQLYLTLAGTTQTILQIPLRVLPSV